MKSWKIILFACLALAFVSAICLALLIRRGFRATTEPSSIERVVARSVRNFAIPSRARNETNPLQPSPEILQDAQNHFMARCASCHGNDGSGVTQMGRNLYPRVPDLRSPDTQTLSDGDTPLHY